MALFEHRGYDAVTFERIAERAEVSPALVHHDFGTKRDVFHGVVDRSIRGFQIAVAPTAAPAPPATGAPRPGVARAPLANAIERYLDSVLERPNGYAFVIGSHGAPDAEVNRAIDNARGAVHRTVLAIVGIHQPTPAQDLAMWGWLGFVERATTRWVDRGRQDRPALVALLLRAVEPVFDD